MLIVGIKVMIFVQNFDIRIVFDAAGGHITRALNIDNDGLAGCVAEELCRNTLDVEDNFGNVFFYAGDSGNFVNNTGNADAGRRNTGKRA